MSTKSQSQSSNATTNLNEDNRVAGADGVTLGKGASFNINNEFSENVLTAVLGLIDSNNRATDAVVTNAQDSLSAAKASLSTVSQSIERRETGQFNFEQYMPALLLLGALLILTRKK